ncbi:MAG: hypothetical protein IJE89_04175 [Bacilli bacterium]|nr:hypothetical protein [Bacilli bacterium]
MENQKNNKGVIALLIVIIIILSVLCVLFATGTIDLKSNDANIIDTNQNVNNNNVQENDEFSLTTFDADKLNSDVPYAVDVAVKVFEETVAEKKYYVRLLKNGKINITQDYHDVTTIISNIENVVDVVGLPVRGSEDYSFYFLLSNGDVYYYGLKDFNTSKIATKVNEVSKVEKIFLAETIIKANQPPYFELIAISDGKYTVIDKCI